MQVNRVALMNVIDAAEKWAKVKDVVAERAEGETSCVPYLHASIMSMQYLLDTLEKDRDIIKDVFGTDTVDPELWDELDSMDDGQRLNVPICVFDLKRIRKVFT